MQALETARLIIRPFTLDDLQEAHSLLDLDLQWAGPGFTIDQRKDKLQFAIYLSRWVDTGGFYGDRAIVLKQDGQLIGLCGFRPWLLAAAERSLFGQAPCDGPFTALELGVGCALSTAHRGKGYAAEAVKALVEYAFKELHVGRIVALAERGNTDSVRLMKRVGMQVGFNPAPVDYPWAVGMIGNNLPGGIA
jgi:RimJ/RimL family protein N-acetyltransferase